MLRMPSDSNLKRLRIIAFSLVMVLVPFVVYYYFYVSNQTKYFTGRDLRVLASLSRHVEESVESQGDVFTNAVKKCLADLGACVQEDDGEQIKVDRNAVYDRYAVYKRLKANPAEYLKQQFQKKALDPLKGDGTNLEITNLEVVAAPADESSIATPKIEIRQGENQRWLYFAYTTRYPLSKPAGDESSVEGKGLPPIYLNFKVRTDLADLVGQFVNKRQIEDNQGSYEGDGFDAIVLAEVDDAVDVIFQESSGKLRIASLNNLTNVSDGAKIDLKLLGQSTNMADVKVGAGEYKLFFQPVKLPLAGLGGPGKEEINWIACGFVESGRFRRESWSVSYTVLIVFGFVAVLVALSWPFLKLLLIGPKDRFRPIDTYLLVVSAVMITALLTLFASFAHSYLRSERLLDNELGAFAGAIQHNFTTEVGQALKEIDELNCNRKLMAAGFTMPPTCEPKENTPPVSQTPGKTVNRHAAYPFKRKPVRSDVAGRRRILTEDTLTHYPYFMSAFWADRLGLQRIKWTTRPNLTNNVDVSQREFFYKLRQGLNYTYRDDTKRDHKFFLQPIVSRTTGQSEVVIAKPVYPFDDRQMWISALITRPLSLMQPVVPTGFGFAVIDDEGKVLFHSDEKQHLGENLFEECDNNQALRAAVLGRSEQSLTGSYLGKGHSLYVRPMGQFGWTVVTFRNKECLRTTFSEILTLCLVLFFTYLLALMILILIVYVVNRMSKNRATWLWPAPNKIGFYNSLLGLNVVLTVLSAASVRWLPGLWKITAPIGIAFAAFLLFVCILKRSKDRKLCTKLVKRLTRRSVLNHRTAYVVNATLLFALISIIPAYACFKLAYAEELKLFVKEGQLSLAKSLANREDRLRAQYLWANAAGNKTSPMEERLNARLQDASYDVYNSFFYQTKLDGQAGHGEAAPSQDSKFVRFFKNFVPLFNQTSIERHALMWPTADQSWKWEEPSTDKLVLHVNGALTATQKSTTRNIVSILPPLNGSLWWLIWPLLLFFVALLVAYMAHQIFLFKRDDAKSDELEDFCADSISQNYFLVLNPPFIGKRELLKQRGLDNHEWDRIDFEQTAQVERWIKKSMKPEPGREQLNGHRKVIIDNFDFAIENSSHNQQRLSLLEKIHELKRVAVAVSKCEPDRFMQTNGHSEGSTEHHNGSSPVITERWTGAVSRFFKVTLEDEGDPRGFRKALRARKRQLLADKQLTPAAREEIESLFETLEHECSPRACLQSIGEGLANQRRIIKQKSPAIIKQVLVQAIPYYKSIWRVCSDDEKLTLSHLAQDGLLSSKDPDIERLMKKGLIVREPAVRLMNKSFKAFIRGIDDDDALAQCEAEARQSSNWEVLKVPLTIGVTSVMGFLLLTQRDIYNSALPFITALTAGVPSFFKLLSLFHGGDSGGKGGG